MNKDEHNLCFIGNGYAYFTDKSIADTTGDDWDNKPYDSNAGLPKYYTFRVYFWSLLQQPCDFHYAFSAKEINDARIPWLFAPVMSALTTKVWAGAMFKDFVKAVIDSGGEVYVPIDWVVE